MTTAETDLDAQGTAAFFRAIRDRDHDRLRALAASEPALARAIDPHHCCGGTVMNVAVGLGDTALLETLLELGADPNQPSEWPPGPFRALNSIPDDHLDTLGPWLLARGAELDAHAAAKLGRLDDLRAILDADPEALHRQGPDGQRPLHVARTVEIAAFLLHRGADLEARCVDHGSTPAEYAATSRPEVCRFLLDGGARGDPFMFAMCGDLPRLEATLEDDPATLHLRVTPDRFRPAEGEAAHIYMYTIGEGCTLLHAAAARGQGEVIRRLCRRGLDPNLRGGYDEQTAAHAAAWSDRGDAIRVLAAAGADLELPSGEIHRNPPAGWAVVNGSVSAIEALLEAGVRVLDHYVEDARRGIGGAFRQWSSSGPERFQAILEMLEAARPR